MEQTTKTNTETESPEDIELIIDQSLLAIDEFTEELTEDELEQQYHSKLKQQPVSKSLYETLIYYITQLCKLKEKLKAPELE